MCGVQALVARDLHKINDIIIYIIHGRSVWQSVWLYIPIYSLEGNSITNEGAVALSEALKSITTLQEL